MVISEVGRCGVHTGRAPLTPMMRTAGIERDQMKMKAQIQMSVKKNDVNGAKIMAKALARSNKTIERMHMTKSKINSVGGRTR